MFASGIQSLRRSLPSCNTRVWGVNSVFARRLATDSSTQKFFNAVAAIQSPPNPSIPKKEVGNDTKLKLYAYFKQAEQGACSGDRPGMFDLVGRAKYDAWKALGSLPNEEAKLRYISIVEDIFNGQIPIVKAAEPVVAKSTSPQPEHATVSKKARTLADVAFPRNSVTSCVNKETILCSTAANVSRVVLNRPRRGNSFNFQMWEDLHQTWEAVNNNKEVKVVILQGAEANFSTGMDLSVFVDFQGVLAKENCEGRKREAVAHFIQYLQDAISGPENCPVPVIAAVHGQCIGGAIDLICAADLRYCTKDAIFCIKETDLAIVADIGTLQRFPKLVGTQKCAELTYTARNFNGVEAEQMGLVAKSFDTKEEMNEYVNKVATDIASKSPLTIRGVKKTILYARDHSVVEALEQVKALNSSYLLSNDLVEAATAIMEKRTPHFKDL